MDSVGRFDMRCNDATLISVGKEVNRVLINASIVEAVVFLSRDGGVDSILKASGAAGEGSEAGDTLLALALAAAEAQPVEPAAGDAAARGSAEAILKQAAEASRRGDVIHFAAVDLVRSPWGHSRAKFVFGCVLWSMQAALSTPGPVAPAVLAGVPVPAVVAPAGLAKAPVSRIEPALATSEQVVAAAEATAWR